MLEAITQSENLAMSAVQLVPTASDATFARSVADTVEPALKKAHIANVAASANAAGFAAAAFLRLPEVVQAQLGANEGLLADVIFKAFASLATGKTDKLHLETATAVESRKGKGLGAILSADEGRQAVREYATDLPLEEWAGPVAGSTELERDLGIGRTTLHNWQKSGSVIGLLKGTRKHVFPREQFIDGRPLEGIAQVNRVVGNPRTAWLWLRTPNPTLSGKAPIALLKANRVKDVVSAAEGYFAQL